MRRWMIGAVVVALMVVAGLTSISCNRGQEDQSGQQGGTQANAVYTCPMHPEIQEAKPGKCPKCGMELVKKQ